METLKQLYVDPFTVDMYYCVLAYTLSHTMQLLLRLYKLHGWGNDLLFGKYVQCGYIHNRFCSVFSDDARKDVIHGADHCRSNHTFLHKCLRKGVYIDQLTYENDDTFSYHRAFHFYC